ncbi:hypothetical protein ABT224_39220, partial [Streptomyces sp. NPDC001584]
MGIESDHLVYEYLSRVGDLAQQRQLSSGDRMRLVSGLRDEIDRRRAKYDPDTPAAVRRILERIGTPEEVLDTLGSRQGAAAAPAPAPAAPADAGLSVPVQRGPGRLRSRKAAPARPAAEPENVPPHLAGLDELGPSGGAEPDWWRVSPATYGAGPQVDGFAGGIEIPDLFKEGAEDEPREGETAPAPPGEDEGRARSLVRFLRERRRAKRAAAAAAAGASTCRRSVDGASETRPTERALNSSMFG